MARTIDYIIDVDTGDSLKSVGQLEAKMEQLNEEIKDVDVNSQAFDDLSKQVQGVQREINKATNAIEGFTFEDRIEGFQGGIQALAGGFEAVSGAVALAGIESEEFEKTMTQLFGGLAIAQGAIDLSEGIGKIGTSLQKSGKLAKLFGSTTKKALAATGVGLFALALGAIVTNWNDITKAVKRFANNFPIVGKAIDAIKEAFNTLYEAAEPVLQFFGILPSEAEKAEIAFTELTNQNIQNLNRQLAIAQAAGATAKELFDIRKQLIEEEIALLETQADKEEELFDKRTELMALEAAEQKRLADEREANREREKVSTVSSIKAVGLAQIETNDAVAPTIDNVTAANFRAQEAQKVYNAEALKAAEREHGKMVALGATADALQALGGVLDQESAASKALAISSAIINTYLGVTEVLKQPSTLPSPFDVITKVANVATILASGFSAVQSIKSTPPKGGSGSPSGNVAGPRGATVSTPSIQDIIGETEQVPQAQPQQAAVRAYVVTGDVSSGQQAENKIKTKKTFGG